MDSCHVQRLSRRIPSADLLLEWSRCLCSHPTTRRLVAVSSNVSRHPLFQLQLDLSTLPGSIDIKISLNALDFSLPITYHYTPTYMALSSSPSVGPISGSTTIDITGTSIDNTNTNSFSELTCRMGIQNIPASLIDATTLRCHSPSLHSAAGIHEHLISDDRMTYQGVARPQGAGFVLTDLDVPFVSGAILVFASDNPNLHPQLPSYPQAPAFNITFQIRVAAAADHPVSGNGMGFSVNYGDLDGGMLSEYGGEYGHTHIVPLRRLY